MKPSDVDRDRLPWLKMSNPVKPFYPLDPRPEEIDIQNIAWSLSMQCRFNGHLSYFYSVAQHSVIVSRIVEAQHPFDNKLILRALLHDAAEAYVGDVITPIKKLLPYFYEIEEKIEHVIMEKYGLEIEMPECVKEADIIAVVTESRDLHPVAYLDDCFEDIEPLDYKIVAVDYAEAYDMFMSRFESLMERIRFTEFQESHEKETA